MDVFKRGAENLRRWWSGLSPTRKVILGASLAGIALLFFWGSSSAAGGMVKVAGLDMPEDDRAQIVKKLQEKNYKFEVRDREIYLPAADAERVMFELNAEGVFSEEAIFKHVLAPDLLGTRQDKDKKFQIALQWKLERMLRNIRGVQNASVQVTPQADSDRFFNHTPKSSASVQLQLAPGHVLSDMNVNAVAGLVARAVSGLDPDRVHIMDTAGRAYRVRKADDSAHSAYDILHLEMQYEDRIKAKIEHVFPDARVVVRFQAQPKETHVEEVKFGKGVPVYEKDRRVEDRGGVGGGVPGIKGEREIPAAVAAGPGQQSVRESEVKYDRDVRTEKTIKPAGAVEKITVGVLVPVREDALEQMRKNETAYKDLIVKASGTEPESVSLLFVPTRPPAPLPVPTFWEEAGDYFSSRASTVVGVVLAVLVLGILYAIVRRALSGRVAEDLEALKSRLSEEVALLPAPGVPLREEDVVRVKANLRDMAARNPRAIAGILKRWLAGK